MRTLCNFLNENVNENADYKIYKPKDMIIRNQDSYVIVTAAKTTRIFVDGRKYSIKAGQPTKVHVVNDLDCTKSHITTVDFSHFDASTFNSFAFMFRNCSELEHVDMSGLNTSNVKDMRQMFYGCDNLKTVDLSGWDVSKLENIDDMFAHDGNLVKLNLTGWTPSRVISMNNAFARCGKLKDPSLKKIKFPPQAVAAATNKYGYGPFQGCPAFE